MVNDMNIIWKKTLKALLIILISIIITSLLINLFYYFDIINNNLVKYLKMILSMLSFFLGGIYMGKNSPNKGYLYGLRLSLIIIILLLILGIIFNNLNLSRIIYYLIITFTITFGAMLGINKKTN